MPEVSWEELRELCAAAVRRAGGDGPTSDTLADSIVAAERRGKSEVGVTHLFDYLEALQDGRLNGRAQPVLTHDHSSVVIASADDGIAQLAFRKALPTLVAAARSNGVAVLSVRDSFTTGELGYYAWEAASAGLVSLACSHSPALMSLYDAPAIVAGTNPFSFAVPTRPTPHMVDQASSVTAWVKIRDAAAAGTAIPEGWALDKDGNPTTDAASALLGPLLPSGGARGSNIALVIEFLSVLSGGWFSIDASRSTSADGPPRVGMFMLVLSPDAFSADYLSRVERHLERLDQEYGITFGRRRALLARPRIADGVLARLVTRAGTTSELGSRSCARSGRV